MYCRNYLWNMQLIWKINKLNFIIHTNNNIMICCLYFNNFDLFSYGVDAKKSYKLYCELGVIWHTENIHIYIYNLNCGDGMFDYYKLNEHSKQGW